VTVIVQVGSSTSILALEVSSRVSWFPVRKTITWGRKWHVENTVDKKK
jgi:hypothetical protein